MSSGLVGGYMDNFTVFPNCKRTAGLLVTFYDAAHRFF